MRQILMNAKRLAFSLILIPLPVVSGNLSETTGRGMLNNESRA